MSQNKKRCGVVSGTPPGDSCVGEVILRDVLGYVGPNRFALATVGTDPFRPASCPDLSFVADQHIQSSSRMQRTWPGRLGALESLLWYARAERRHQASAGKALAFFTQHNAAKIWVVLNTPAMIATAYHLARKTTLPVYALVWDAPEIIAQQYGLDRMSTHRVMKQFACVLSKAVKTGVVSDAMADRYRSMYGAKCVITRHAIDKGANTASRVVSDGRPIRIGFAGGLYAFDAWSAFLGALDQLEWQLDGRLIQFIILGSDTRIRVTGRAHIEMMGWRSNEETRDILSTCDWLYLPQPFNEGKRLLAELSFPTKLSTYLAAGSPVIVHAPGYASLPRYFEGLDQPPGFATSNDDPRLLAELLRTKLQDDDLMYRSRLAAAKLVTTEFSMAASRKAFTELLDE